MSAGNWMLLIGASLLSGLSVGMFIFAWLPLWDQAAAWQMGGLTGRFRRLGLNVTHMKFYLRVWGVAVASVFCLFWFVLRAYPLAAVGTLLAYVAPRHILDWIIRFRARTLRDQLAVASVGLSNAAKAGLSLAQGLEAVAAESPAPLSRELGRITFEFQRGRPLKEAIEVTRQRLELEAFTLFALAIEAAIERGGPINKALQRISDSLVEYQRLERKLETETSAGRQVVILLSLFPVGFVGVYYLLNPSSTELLFSTFVGQCVLVAVIVLVYAGARWAASMLRIEL
jgi:tight adherence protein B